MKIEEIVSKQRAFFETGATREPKYRRDALERLRTALLKREDAIYEALRADLHKPAFETYMTELGMVLDELRFQLRHLTRWAKPQRVRTPVAQFYSSSFTLAEPYGVALILAPWNYPLQLSLEPLIGAIAAGNCVVLKPSAYAPASSRVMAEAIADAFAPEYVAVVEGGRQQNTDLLEQRFDYIFFTGGVTVGRLVMQSAAKNLTPLTLELGGKSPCVVDATANIPLAARRIAFGKFLNAGQTCVAPDYVLVQSGVKDALVQALKREISAFFGPQPLENDDYPRIVSEKHFNRLQSLLRGTNILAGGETNGRLQLSPTLVDGVTGDSPVMREEIFGPILPILTFDTVGEAVSFVARREKPLALYLFTTDRDVVKQVLSGLSFGGGCVNDTIIHLATSFMSFGGVGQSGMGSYHGRASFETFSNRKSIVKKSNRIDLPMRYHPYTEANFRLLKHFLR